MPAPVFEVQVPSCLVPRLALTPLAFCRTRPLICGSSFGSHCSPEPVLWFGIPVSASQLKKNRRIWDPQICFDQEHSKHFADLIKLGNDVLVQKRVHLMPVEKALQSLPVFGDAWGILLRNKLQFFVQINCRFDVTASANNRKRSR